jgi:hypothetical protein
MGSFSDGITLSGDYHGPTGNGGDYNEPPTSWLDFAGLG